MAISLDKVFGVYGDALVLRSKRSEILASNLVNADTPNYKARDFDFKAALDQATQKAGPLDVTHANHLSGGRAALQVTNAAHLQLSGQRPPATGELAYRVPGQDALDGNTVDPEREKSEFAQNALQYQATLQFLSGKIKTLKDVLQEA